MKTLVFTRFAKKIITYKQKKKKINGNQISLVIQQKKNFYGNTQLSL